MQNDPPWLTRLEHTADEAVEVSADRLGTLFERAAWAMFALIAELRTVEASCCLPVRVDAADREALLVAWLSELNVQHQIRHLLFCRFQVDRIDATRLAARAWGQPVDPERHEIYTEIKAVTYHGLSVRETGGMWRARILFDV